MHCVTMSFLSTEMGRKLIAPAATLVLPPALAIWCRHKALQQIEEDERKAVWLGYRRVSRLVIAATLAAWWAIWDSNGLANLLPVLVPGLEPSSVKTLLFWSPPIVSLSAFLALVNIGDAALLKLKWTVADVLRLVWWRLMNFVVPLLMIATGFDAILHGDLWGCAWITVAGIVAIVGTIGLRRAEGMKLHEVKASETRNRALAMARRMGIDLRRIYVVPAGRGHLTNAFGGGSSIGLTDNLGKYLNRQQIDFVIAHELAHVQRKHGRNKWLLAVAIFFAMTVVVFFFRRDLILVRPLLNSLIILVPLGTFYLFSRHCEYEADRNALDFTGDPESGMRAIAGLRRVSGEPMQCNRFTEMFLTHPAFARRIEAIGRAGGVPSGRTDEILRQSCPPASVRSRATPR